MNGEIIPNKLGNVLRQKPYQPINTGNTGNVRNHTKIVTFGTKVTMIMAPIMVTTLPR
jgi:hypothetical protein